MDLLADRTEFVLVFELCWQVKLVLNAISFMTTIANSQLKDLNRILR